MSSDDMFVKFVCDDSVLSSRLEESDEKLNEHDELIKELQKKLENLATNSQLEFMHDSLVKEFDKKINDMNNKFQNILNSFNSTIGQIKNLCDGVDTKINSLTEYFDSKTQQTYDNIMATIANTQDRFKSFEDRISECENKIGNHGKEISNCYTNIQYIASSIASFNNSDVILDKNLRNHLEKSVNHVKVSIHKIYEELARLKNASQNAIPAKSGINDNLSALLQLQQQGTSGSRIPSSSQKPSILSPHVQKPGRNISSQPVNQKQQSQSQQYQNIDQLLGSGKVNDADILPQQNNEMQHDKSELENKMDSFKPQIEESTENIKQPQPPPSQLNNQQQQQQKQDTQTQTETNSTDTDADTNTSITTTSSNDNQSNVTFSSSSIKKASSGQQLQQQQQQPQIYQTRNSAPPYDLTKVRPYSEIQTHWQDRPRLPEIRPFLKIEEVVDHIYKVQPYIQAYLNSMHGKLLESSTQLQQKVDKNLVEKMFERMQGIVADINLALNRLKDEVQQTATRKEINGFIEELMKSTRSDAQTAVGRVRCIACGRETMQITGAMTEAEIERALGSNTPNSLVRGVSNHKPGVSYSSTDGFDSAIVEEPRSKRPAQTIMSQSQYSQMQQPLVKTKAKFQ